MEQLVALEKSGHEQSQEHAAGAGDAGAGGRVLSASLAMGFPWADIEHVGMAFVVPAPAPASPRRASPRLSQA